jgi:hypothetical protein
MQTGPLIPGMREIDAPRRSHAATWLWILGAVGLIAALVVLAGVVGGVGPLRALGARETPLQPVAYRLTSDPAVLQVAVALPTSGLCAGDEVRATGVERGPRVEVAAARVQAPGQEVCSGVGIAGDSTWVDVVLDQPLGERTVIRVEDRQPLPREAAVPVAPSAPTP